MPGFDPKTDRRINDAEIAQLIANYLQVPASMLADQARLLAQQSLQSPKRVFDGNSQCDAVNSYPIFGSDIATLLWKSFGATTVKVFDLQDATEVEISVMLPTAGTFPIIGFVMSPDTVTNPVPLSNAVLLGGNYYGNTVQSNRFPCAGNRYIHIFGRGTTVGDLWLEVLNTTSSSGILTMGLIK